MDNGTIKLTWRLGVVVAVSGSIIGGAFWAGRFTSRVDKVDINLKALTSVSQTMGVKVDLLRERAAADAVQDIAVERRLRKIEDVLVRIEELIRERYQRNQRGYEP